MPEYSGRVIESQVDWLTVSAHGEDSARNMLDLAQGLARSEELAGAKRRPWRLMGYDGHHVGRTEYGQRDSNSTILRLIGQPAEDHLTVALSVADSVTRLDLAVTWRAAPPDPHIGRNAYSLAYAHWDEDHRRSTPWHVEDARGGYTLYLGNRESDNFFRLYNKEAEARALDDEEQVRRYEACWRYELETKASTAMRLAHLLGDVEDRASYVQGYLNAYVERHGMPCPFPRPERYR